MVCPNLTVDNLNTQFLFCSIVAWNNRKRSNTDSYDILKFIYSTFQSILSIFHYSSPSNAWNNPIKVCSFPHICGLNRVWWCYSLHRHRVIKYWVSSYVEQSDKMSIFSRLLMINNWYWKLYLTCHRFHDTNHEQNLRFYAL